LENRNNILKVAQGFTIYNKSNRPIAVVFTPVTCVDKPQTVSVNLKMTISQLKLWRLYAEKLNYLTSQ